MEAGDADSTSLIKEKVAEKLTFVISIVIPGFFFVQATASSLITFLVCIMIIIISFQRKLFT